MSESKALVAGAESVPSLLPRTGARGRELWERGLTTVEYAIGIVLVLTIVTLLIKATGESWFDGLVQGLLNHVFDLIQKALKM